MEIAHVLFMDIVGYSKLVTDQQRELLNELNKIVRETPQFKQAEAVGKLIRRAGNVAASRATYQRAVQEFTQELSTVSEDSGPAAALHSWLGIAYAGLGNAAAAAVSEGQKSMAQQPTSEDPFEGPGREEQMAQIYALLGNADEAMPILKRLLHTSSFTGITPELMRIDPIRNDPRFKELVAEKTP